MENTPRADVDVLAVLSEARNLALFAYLLNLAAAFTQEPTASQIVLKNSCVR